MNFAQYKQWGLEGDLRFANNYEEEIVKWSKETQESWGEEDNVFY